MAQKDIDVQANGTHASAPSPAEGFEVLLITGMSGAGRSHAADSIEDMGWYVVDNMPPKLLVPLVDDHGIQYSQTRRCCRRAFPRLFR